MAAFFVLGFVLFSRLIMSYYLGLPKSTCLCRAFAMVAATGGIYAAPTNDP